MHFITHAKSSLPALILGTTLVASSANAVELLNVESETGTTVVSLGGYAKVDFRHVSGDIAYQDYWVGNFPGGAETDTSHTGFNIKESRLNFKVTHGDVTGFVEFDMYGGDGNEVVSNSTNPRIRHYFIQYQNWLAGQTWTTFQTTSALPEALDFGGSLVASPFVRQTQLRYTNGPLQIALENPETNGDGDAGVSSSAVGVTGANADPDESIPDLIAKYTFSGDWGSISTAGMLRSVDQGGEDETAFAINVSGKIKVGATNDFRFQLTTGDPGRYVGPALTPDIVTDSNGNVEVESTNAFTVAYRHFWNPKTRSTFYYGLAETDVLERERSHWGVNLITDLQPKLSAGIELGQYAVDDEGIDGVDSTYFQVSTKFAF